MVSGLIVALIKCIEDLRLADVVSDVSYRYLNNISWEIECL